MKFDLHLHTNHSDGRLNPAEVVNLAVTKGLSGIAITDHDTVTGIEAAIIQSRKYKHFTVIPGIELSCIHKEEEVHILGYFIDYTSREMLEVTNKLKTSRIQRGKKIVKRLNDLGMDISLKEVQNLSREDYIGRPHIARIMVNKGYVSTLQEAFDKYLNIGKPAYVERYKLSIEDSISLIKLNGGIPILAHPGLLKDRNIIKDCISLGIEGLECIHSKHNENDTKLFFQISKENDLISTGGSDCHGDTSRGPLLIGKYFIDINKVPIFKEMI